jgi:hypothetical protein
MCAPEYSVRLQVHVWKMGSDYERDWAKDVKMRVPPLVDMLMTLDSPGNEDEPWFTEIERINWDERHNRVTAYLKEEDIGEDEDDSFLKGFESDPNWYDPYGPTE